MAIYSKIEVKKQKLEIKCQIVVNVTNQRIKNNILNLFLWGYYYIKILLE